MNNASIEQAAFCPYCGSELIAPAEGKFCNACGKEVPVLAAGKKPVDYQSSLTVFGWPLLHIALGPDPKTRKPGVARGLIAIGDIAIGGIAAGGVCIGGIALGGVGLGMVSFGGVAIGLLMGIGGLAVSGGLGLGGLAIASFAFGGMALGYYAMGGFAIGAVAEGGGQPNPAARNIFDSWQIQAENITSFVQPAIVFLILAPFILLLFIKRRPDPDSLTKGELDLLKPGDLQTQPKGTAAGLGILILMGGITGICFTWLLLVIVGMLL